MTVTDAMLSAAVRKAVEVGLVPKAGFIDVCDENCRKIEAVVRAAIEADRHAFAKPAPMGQWQPISTAPKTTDNLVAIPILGFCPDEHNGDYGSDDRIRVAWWEPRLGGGRWYDERELKTQPNPTHWMPLPEPPEI